MADPVDRPGIEPYLGDVNLQPYADQHRQLLDAIAPLGYLLGQATVGDAKHAFDEDGDCPCPEPEEGDWSDECSALNAWGPALLHDERAHGFSVFAHLVPIEED